MITFPNYKSRLKHPRLFLNSCSPFRSAVWGSTFRAFRTHLFALPAKKHALPNLHHTEDSTAKPTTFQGPGAANCCLLEARGWISTNNIPPHELFHNCANMSTPRGQWPLHCYQHSVLAVMSNGKTGRRTQRLGHKSPYFVHQSPPGVQIVGRNRLGNFLCVSGGSLIRTEGECWLDSCRNV